MPVARIITNTPDEVHTIAEQLRTRGFTVEIVSPEQTGLPPAEVEVFVESYPWREALRQAGETAQAAEADVLVASGIYDVPQSVSLAREFVELPPEPEVELAPEPEPQIQQQSEPAIHLAPQPEPLPPWREPEPAVKTSVLRDLAAATTGGAREVARGAGGRLGTLARASAARFSQQTTQLQQRLHARRRAKAVRPAPAAESERSVLRDLAVILRRAGREMAARTAAAGNRLRIFSRVALSSLAEQMSQRRRKLQERRERAAGAPPSPLPDRPLRLAAALFTSEPAAPKPVPQRLPVIRRTRERDHEWRLAAAVSLTLAVAITMAWAFANRHPASPLPTSVLMKSNEMEQQVPFGPVTLPAPDSAAKVLLAAALNASPISPAKPARRQENDEVVVRHFNSKPAPPSASAKRARSSGDDEVVVRHITTKPAAAPAPAHDGVKRISD